MALNPVERRLAELSNHWLAFREDEAKRLLVWRVKADAASTVQCFFEVQKLDLPYATQDLFVVLSSPFTNAVAYAAALKAELAQQYAASKAQLAEQGIATSWQYSPSASADTPAAILAALHSFGSAHHAHIGHLVAVLKPREVADVQAWGRFVARVLASGAISPRMRLLMVDATESTALDEPLKAHAALCTLQRLNINTLAMAQETFAQEKTTGPAGVFRNLLMAVVALIETGSANQVKAKARDALAFAQAQKWLDQEVVVRMLVGGALLKEQRHAEAVQVYEAARAAALQCVEQKHSSGQKLVLQALFGQAGAHVAAGELEPAAACYDLAATHAQADHNPAMAIEALRMAAYCHARNGVADEARTRGNQALYIGEQLKPEARPMTTLPVAAVDQLRLIDAARVDQLQQIKNLLVDVKARNTADATAKAEQLDASATPQDTVQLQQQLEDGNRKADEQASVAVQSVVGGGSLEFRSLFMRCRSLLGEAWPLVQPLALPVADHAAVGAAKVASP